jgi:dTDP-4-dehydrorhamnose 3,5-epimerase
LAVRVERTDLDGVLLVVPDVYRDDRGFFFESYNALEFEKAGVSATFVQDNHSRSGQGVLRGIHYQDESAPLDKLVRCTRGAILDVAVDLRVGSPTFASWYGCELTAENMRQIYIPSGFGHAFLALSDGSEVQYKCTGYYERAAEGSIRWNDPEIGVRWPAGGPILSEKDASAPSIGDYLRFPAFRFEGGS